MYDCNEAQQLLKAGVRPAARPPERALLGFHIVNCADCRAVLQRILDAENALLLASLLADEPPEPVVAVQPKPRWRWIGLAFAVMLGIATFGVWWLGFSHASTNASNAVSATALVVPTEASIFQPPPSAVPSSVAFPTFEPYPIASPSLAAFPTTEYLLPPTPPPAPPATFVPRTASPPLANPAAEPSMLGAINILLLGLDRRPDEIGVSRSDSLIVVHIDPISKTVAMVSLPRDLWVTLPEPYNYPVKINAAYMNGETDGGAAGGAEVARQTVSAAIGQPIQHVIVTTFEGLIKIVNHLGGVDITVEKEIYDPTYPTWDYGYMVAHFLPGRQSMDGETALIYSRTRHADSDFERGKRQQQVLLAIAVKLRQQLRSSDFVTRLTLISDLQNDLEYTSLDPLTVTQLAILMPEIQPEAVRRDSVDLRYGYEDMTYDGAYIIQPDLPAIQQLVATLFSGK